ncbi:deSI-like protein At4g17486 [Aristolochia californica]|uniref:deSI-like protein At4g17486 n=1 Tax=Aristolochia californica TaxID=171875 RepID=UPI0035DEF27F
MFRAFSSKRKTGTVPVYLNVYDLTPINGYAYWLGLGIYHSGVQVHDVEYAFGAHEYPTTGIFEGEPRQCPGFTFRKSILIGRTDLGPREVRAFMEKLAEEYTGNTYHLITKNCNHFCNDACLKLAGKSIPRWVNRLAKIGLFCNCVLPIGLHVAGVRHRADARICEGEKRKLRSNSNRFVSSSSSTFSTTTTTNTTATITTTSASGSSSSTKSSRSRHKRSPSPHLVSSTQRSSNGV